MNDNAAMKTQRIHIALLEVSAAYGKLLTALHRLHNATKGNVEDSEQVEMAVDAINAIPTLRQILKDKYPIPKVMFKQ